MTLEIMRAEYVRGSCPTCKEISEQLIITWDGEMRQVWMACCHYRQVFGMDGRRTR